MTDKITTTQAITALENMYSSMAEIEPTGAYRVLCQFIEQSQQAQGEPVAAQQRFRHPQKTAPDWSIWQPAEVDKTRPSWEVDSQGYEVEYRLLYTSAPAAVPESVNPAVMVYAYAMQYKLDKNKHKDGPGWPRHPDGSRSGWADCSIAFLTDKLDEEVQELLDALFIGDKEAIRNEAADVGNIAMMMADVSGALAATPQPATSAVPDWEREAKRAFWAGLEIGENLAGFVIHIAPRWEEYIKKRKSELAIPTTQKARSE